MRIAAVAALVAAAVFAPGAAAATGLSVSPLRLSLVGAARATITIGNPSARPLVVSVGRAGFAETLRGRPRLRAASGAAAWLRFRPQRFRLAPHAKAVLRVRATPPVGASPGDHPALVLLETQEPGEPRVRVLLRVGVVVLIRVPGPVVHRLVPRFVAVRRRGAVRLLDVRLANRGNVTERLRGQSLQLGLWRHGREVGTLHARHIELLPHSAGIAEFVYRGRLRGAVVARIMRRSFRLKL